MKNTTWNTYRTTGYTHDVANDPRSTGGVHHHQIRKTAKGWQKRIRQSNGNHSALGPVSTVSDTEGRVAWEMALKH